MARTTTIRKYGRNTRKQTAELLFAQLPTTPVKPERQVTPPIVSEGQPVATPMLESQKGSALGAVELRKPGREAGSPPSDEMMHQLVQQFDSTRLDDVSTSDAKTDSRGSDHLSPLDSPRNAKDEAVNVESPPRVEHVDDGFEELGREEYEVSYCDDLRVLTWADVCAAGDRVEKIAEASFAEVYRITNAHGTSIIKVVRLESPIKQQTKAQVRSGLVDEEPHSEEDMQGELRISEWLADIPGFVVYKEKYVVEGKAPKALLETHQAFHRRMKRSDPDRLQFYPSPSRYLDDTRFLVVELGDAGTALEDFELTSINQVWDIFLHTALALARAEDLIQFEHRDLHEGNLCIRQTRQPTARRISTSPQQFGFSGLDVTILDYGLCRASDPDSSCLPDTSTTTTTTSTPPPTAVAYDLEKDLTLFQSTHAPQCAVYRQMRAFLIHNDRFPPPEEDPSPTTTPYPTTPYPPSSLTNKPISWTGYFPYTNVLWLAYLYAYLVGHFRGDAAALRGFRRQTRELRAHLDPAAPRGVLSFPSAGEVVRFAVEAGHSPNVRILTHGYRATSVAGHVAQRNTRRVRKRERRGKHQSRVREDTKGGERTGEAREDAEEEERTTGNARTRKGQATSEEAR
ncbi:uncharacterized protein B0H64DRAFT_432539 [Chaetomium fimeti]|uniref:non-specific serine/threonine protein kinase n=1 Tax=Chaetomium fimeti TaxID=1854472 RepID=A0AAE0LSQ0_9PEZI|nr:hypothetical protein B0H64DRAFT_432539 [Chaetomium fimeti]